MTWAALAPELAVCGWILLMLASDLILPAHRKSSLWILALSGVLVAGSLLAQVRLPPTGALAPGTWQAMWQLDPLGQFFKALFLLTVGVVIIMTRAFSRHGQAHLGCLYMLLFTALLGMFVIASLNDLLMLFIGLELLTFSLYIMAAYLKTDARSIEAGMKYLILGSVSSGFLVYGIALLYGCAGGTSFASVRAALAGGGAPLTAQAGVLLVLAGLGFKLAVVPFHLWVPDVYEGAPTPVVALLSAGSKMAGAVAILRVLHGPFAPLQGLWADALAALSAATLLYGNLGAIPQTDIKRFLGYSSIGHAGYLLMGISTASVRGATAVGFYLLAYLFSTLAVFLVVVTVSDAAGGDALDDYRGLSRRSGVLAGAMFVGLLSLAGVPPMAGFVGKLLVLLAATESDRIWLVVLGAVNVAISLYYYLMVVKRMYLDGPRVPSPIPVDALTKMTLGALVAGILLIGIVQEPFLRRVTNAVGSYSESTAAP